RNLAAKLAASSATRVATAGSRYGRPLRARVLDARGQPLDGVTVTFTLGTGSTGASAAFPGGTNQATALTGADGRATSPPLHATPRRSPATAARPGSDRATYRLRNAPARLLAAGAAQTTTVDARYRRPLGARVLDARGQPLEGVAVTFTLPQAENASGASFVG